MRSRHRLQPPSETPLSLSTRATASARRSFSSEGEAASPVVSRPIGMCESHTSESSMRAARAVSKLPSATVTSGSSRTAGCSSPARPFQEVARDRRALLLRSARLRQSCKHRAPAHARFSAQMAALAGGGACLRDTESRTNRRLIWKWPIDPQRAGSALRQPGALGCYRSLKLGLEQPLGSTGSYGTDPHTCWRNNEGPSSVPGPSRSMLLCLSLRRVSVLSGLVPERAVVL